MKSLAALILAAACGGYSVHSVTVMECDAGSAGHDAGTSPPGSGDLCAEGAGSSPCVPGAVCVQTTPREMACVCCTKWSAGFFPLTMDADACTATAAQWLAVCPPRP